MKQEKEIIHDMLSTRSNKCDDQKMKIEETITDEKSTIVWFTTNFEL